MTVGEVRMTQVQHLSLGPSQCLFFYTSCHPLTSTLGMGGKSLLLAFPPNGGHTTRQGGARVSVGLEAKASGACWVCV